MAKRLCNFIAGHWQETVDWIDDVNPATGEVIALIPRSTSGDVDAAVAAAKAALPAWSATPREERCAILHRIADAIEAEAEAFAAMETEDTGKPITTSRTIDVPRAVRNFRFFADFAASQPEQRFDMEGGSNRTHRKPVGVVALVTPWNLPLYLLSWKVAPALAMGNTIVAKPSEFTPQTASALAAIAVKAGLPAGVFNVVHGLGAEAGQALVGHDRVSAVSFTGGTATGRIVAATAAPQFKKLSLELGGKNPGIVFADCDLDATVAGIVRASFTNQGQICLCSSRILVESAIFDAFAKRLTAAVDDLKAGDPQDPDTKLGSLISSAHRDKVEGYLDLARRDGHVHGGARPDLPGAFLNPAIITDVAQDHACVQDEIFGPVITLQPFADEGEAIQLANDVAYGLAATIWTGNKEKGQRVAEALDTGMVWINDWLVRDLRVPFGGMKASGVGREGGTWSLEFFSEARNIYAATP